jgi:hypothetical protein
MFYVTGRTGDDRESGSPEPYYDHHAVHVVGPGTPEGNLHADAVIDTRAAFDVNLMYYPQGVLLAGGPTLVVPGSHFPQINGVDIARYQNPSRPGFPRPRAGDRCGAAPWHLALCHSKPHRRLRYMVKSRRDPRVEQVRLRDTSDLSDSEVRHRIQQTLDAGELWYESSTGVLEKLQRTALFRRLSGDANFGEVEPWLSPLENQGLLRLRDLLP